MSKPKVSLEDLLEAGAHFGHQTKRWNPKMEEYLYGSEKGVHVFDLPKTKIALEEALEFLVKAKKEGKSILILGTKKQIKDKVAEVALEVGLPFVNERWLGGTVSNFEQMKRSLKKMEEMKENMVTGAYNKFTKKERLLIDREIDKLKDFFFGISVMKSLPAALFVIDAKKEFIAVYEKKELNETDITFLLSKKIQQLPPTRFPLSSIEMAISCGDSPSALAAARLLMSPMPVEPADAFSSLLR